MMNFNIFKQMVQQTRSTRRFKPNITINKQELIDLIDLARITSSGKNLQPLKYIPITDEKIKDKVYQPLVWAAHLKDWNQSSTQKPSAYILVINDTNIKGFSTIDSGIAMQTIMLGATSKGYSGSILASIDKDAYKNIFNLATHLEPMFIIAIGIQDEDIQLVDVDHNDTNYYRKDNKHYVPKRTLKDILLDEQ